MKLTTAWVQSMSRKKVKFGEKKNKVCQNETSRNKYKMG